MEKERQKNLIEIYGNCGDDDLIQMIQEGEDNFEEGAYELILAEIQKRGLDDELIEYDDEIVEEINFNEMTDQDLMGVLVNMHTLDELNFHLAAAEAIRRNIDATDVRAYKNIVQCEQCSGGTEIEIIESPRPLIIINTIDEAGLYTDALQEEGIPFEIQISVDDRDYKKAEMATSHIVPVPEDE